MRKEYNPHWLPGTFYSECIENNINMLSIENSEKLTFAFYNSHHYFTKRSITMNWNTAKKQDTKNYF
jgi:hypothetical protein